MKLESFDVPTVVTLLPDGTILSRYGFTISVTAIAGSVSKRIGKLFFLNGSTFSLLCHLTLNVPTQSAGTNVPSKNVCASPNIVTTAGPGGTKSYTNIEINLLSDSSTKSGYSV